MNDDPGTNWPVYYQRTRGRAPRELFVRALDQLPPELTRKPERRAIDLGCGDGTESLALLQRGWHVLALDRQSEALALLLEQLPASARPRLETQLARFEEMVLPRADLVYAGLSLPFCPRDTFMAVWARVEAALSPAGWFAGHFFGERDDWYGKPSMTFLTRETCHQLFAGFRIEQLHEIEKDGATATGPHHIHAFEVIAQRVAG